MSLEDLSSIKGATSSKAVDDLFQNIKNASLNGAVNNAAGAHIATLDDLRNDEVINSSDIEKNLIKQNFPKEKNGFLVVSKVIEA